MPAAATPAATRRSGVVVSISNGESNRRRCRIPERDHPPAGEALLAEAKLAAETLDEVTLRHLTKTIATNIKVYLLDRYSRSTSEQKRRFWEELEGPGAAEIAPAVPQLEL